MSCFVEVLFTPAEFNTLRQQDLTQTFCVVFDILRATSVITAAIHNGAAAVIPVETINEAIHLRRQNPDHLLGGERNGLRISAELSGGVEFNLGNSPREYSSERVHGKTIVSTTTNGTRALRACANAQAVLAASFLNLNAVVEFVRHQSPGRLNIVCAGTHEDTALEDVLAAGNLCERLSARLQSCELADSAEVARRAYRHSMDDLPAAIRTAANARRLLNNPALADDVQFCLQFDCYDVVPLLGKDGAIRKFLPTA
jgi:2-phosphosulfolactate phosphatase